MSIFYVLGTGLGSRDISESNIVRLYHQSVQETDFELINVNTYVVAVLINAIKEKYKEFIRGLTKLGDMVREGLFFFKRFYLIDRQRHSERRNTSRERGRGGLPAGRGARCGTRSRDPGIVARAEGRRLTPEPPRCPIFF